MPYGWRCILVATNESTGMHRTDPPCSSRNLQDNVPTCSIASLLPMRSIMQRNILHRQCTIQERVLRRHKVRGPYEAPFDSGGHGTFCPWVITSSVICCYPQMWFLSSDQIFTLNARYVERTTIYLHVLLHGPFMLWQNMLPSFFETLVNASPTIGSI